MSFVQCADEIFLCELCSQMFEKKEDFEAHLLLHEEKVEKSHFVLQLGDNTDQKKGDENILNISSNLVTVEESLKEENKIRLANKEVGFDVEDKLICEISGVPFTSEKNLSNCVVKTNSDIFIDEEKIDTKKRKLINNEKKSSLECEICCKIFIRTSNLNAHLRTHTKDFYCYICCNSFISQFKLDHHLTEHAEEDIILKKESPAIVHCPYDCIEIFNSKYQLYEHKKLHNSVVEYKCDQCDKKFTYIRQLNSHKKKHEEITDCTVCGKHFSNSKTLKEHFRLHTGERPFECAVCKQTFRCQSYLKDHELVHTGVKNYKCGQCSRLFSRPNYLKDHMRIHFNDRPFVCKFCNENFIQSNILKNHIAKKHRHCTICNLHIGNAMQLRMHVWKCHSESQTNMRDTFVCFPDEQELIGEQTVDCTQSVEDILMKQFL